MIQFLTKLNISDNSGVKSVVCIKVLGGHKKRKAKIGDIIVVTIKKSSSKLDKLKQGKVEKSLVLLTKNRFVRKNGFQLSYNNNIGVIVNDNKLPVANRILSVLPRELKNSKYTRLQTLARTII